MNEPKTEIGKRIREARKKQGLSQKDLAQKAGVSFGTIRRIESSDVKTTLNNIVAIWKALDIDDLFEGMDESFISEAKEYYQSQALKSMINTAYNERLKMESYRPILHQMVDAIKEPNNFFSIYNLVHIISQYELNDSRNAQQHFSKAFQALINQEIADGTDEKQTDA